MIGITPWPRGLVLAGIAAAVLAGCASGPPPAATDTRTYCMETVLKRVTVCTPERVPSAAVEAHAKRFAPSADALTVYVVRGRWADAARLVEFGLDDGVRVGTLPRSLVRMRLRPGEHELSLSWNGSTRRHQFAGDAGEVLFIELAGSAWPWERPYHWSAADPMGSQDRAKQSRLIADIR